MAEVVMPKMGDAMEEGTILRWLKNVGDRVSEQEVIAEVETEKATVEIQAFEEGTLTEILVQPGQTVPVGTPIAWIGERARGGKAGNGGPPESTGDAASASAAKAERAAHEPNGQSSVAPPPAEGRPKASPLARKIAAAHGIDLRTLTGSGPGGRILEADVEEAIQRRGGEGPALPPAAVPVPSVRLPVEPLPGSRRRLSAMRKTIGKRLTLSKQTIPHFYLTLDVDMRAAARVRAEFNAAHSPEEKLSFNDLVLRAAVIALVRHPGVNSRLEDDELVTPDSVHLGVAVSLEEGLIVPVVRDAQTRPITALAREVRDLAARARAGQLQPAEYSGGTFTVSNLGMYDITQFQAVINPPEAAILAVGAVRDTPIVENGQLVAGKQMFLTISVDHRIVDGQVAAVFLQEMQRLLQNPLSLFS